LPGYPTTPLATDEDVLLRASADFPELCPKGQKLAEGVDGAFAVAAPWALTSATTLFAAQGVVSGMVVELEYPPLNQQGSRSFSGKELVAVASADDSAGLTLRRPGHAPGVGKPLAPSAGLANVKFAVPTLAPQLIRATYDIERRFGIDDAVAGRRFADLYDPVELRDAVVLTALAKQYRAMARQAGEGKGDDFWAKAKEAQAELDDVLARLSVHWAGLTSTPGAGGDGRPSNRFGTRLSR
jgi:hypothetical protein